MTKPRKIAVRPRAAIGRSRSQLSMAFESLGFEA